jgi:hypothetical protein
MMPPVGATPAGRTSAPTVEQPTILKGWPVRDRPLGVLSSRRIELPDDSNGGAGDSVCTDGSACREHGSGDSGTNPTGWRQSGSVQNTGGANVGRADTYDKDAVAARLCAGQPELGVVPSVSHAGGAGLTFGEMCVRAVAPLAVPGEFWEHFFVPSVSLAGRAGLTCGELCVHAAAPHLVPGELWEHFVESCAPGRLCERHGGAPCGPRVGPPEKWRVVP